MANATLSQMWRTHNQMCSEISCACSGKEVSAPNANTDATWAKRQTDAQSRTHFVNNSTNCLRSVSCAAEGTGKTEVNVKEMLDII